MTDGADHRASGYGRPGVRRTASTGHGRSTEDHLDRLLGDRDLLLRLQLSDYAQDQWEPVAAEFARYGLAVLQAWIATGRIFDEVHGLLRLRLSSPAQGFDEEAVQDLATDTVMAALPAFLDKVLKADRWDPARGASLKTFFIGQCKYQFPNVHRRWRERRRQESEKGALQAEWSDLDALSAPAPPADQQLLQQEARDEVLALLSTDRARTVCALHDMGYTYEEIATQLGLGDAKIVENLMGYQRRRLAGTTKTTGAAGSTARRRA